MQRVPGIGTVILVAFGLLSAGACGPVSALCGVSSTIVARCVEGLCQAR